MHGFITRAALLAACAIIAAAGAAHVQAQDTAPPEPPRLLPPMRIQCSPARVEGTQCPPPSGVCADTTLGIGGNYLIDTRRRSVTRYDANWTVPQRVQIHNMAGSEITTEESDRYFNAYVTMAFRLGDARTPITYVHSIFPITGSATPANDRPTLRSEGTCVRIGGQRR